MPLSPSSPKQPGQAQRFLINVLWNWLAVAANIFTAIFLTRYMIHKLGDQRYGIWTLAFALIEYVFLFDLGFRSAIVTFVSRYRVDNNTQAINEVVNTALFYFSGVSLTVITLTVTLAGQGHRFFKLAPADRPDFTFLLLLIGFTWAGGIIANIFQACLEAFQQFRIYNHIFIVILLLRAAGCTVVLYLGYNLRGIGLAVVAAQCLGYVLMFATFRRSFTDLRLSWRYVLLERWKEMARYGINSVTAAAGSLFLNQGPPILIGHYMLPAFAGYYIVPARLLNYMVEMIARIGFVTVPKTTELFTLGQTDQIVRLGTYINRYCLSLFLPVSIFVGVFGTELVTRWLGPVFGQQSGPLLPVFAISVALAVAGQFNSSQILFGIAKHGRYALFVVAESLLALAIMVPVLPRFGLFGAACVAVTLAIINRGLITPWLVCSQLHYSYARYMARIYVRPLLTAIPLLALAFWMKAYWLPGRTWLELGTAGAVLGVIGLLLCLFTCVDLEHRVMFWQTFLRKLRPGRQHAQVAG